MLIQITFFVTSVIGAFGGDETRNLALCRAGQYLKPDNTCGECSVGEGFSSGPNRNAVCTPCTATCERFLPLHPCNATHDLLCGCRSGYVESNGDCVQPSEGSGNKLSDISKNQALRNASVGSPLFKSNLEEAKNEVLRTPSNLCREIPCSMLERQPVHADIGQIFTIIVALLAIVLTCLLILIFCKLKRSCNRHCRKNEMSVENILPFYGAPSTPGSLPPSQSETVEKTRAESSQTAEGSAKTEEKAATESSQPSQSETAENTFTEASATAEGSAETEEKAATESSQPSQSETVEKTLAESPQTAEGSAKTEEKAAPNNQLSEFEDESDSEDDPCIYRKDISVTNNPNKRLNKVIGALQLERGMAAGALLEKP